jgi:hypothetical protein
MQTSRLVVQRLATNPAPLTSLFTHRASHQHRACLSRSSSSLSHTATVTSAWLDQAVQQNTQNTSYSSSISLLTSIIRQADGLQHPRPHWQPAGDSTAPSGVVLRELQFQVPAEFAVPAQITVPVHQLVAVFNVLLSAPRHVHKDARALTRGMGAKWSLLRLLLRRSRSPPDVFEACLNEVLSTALEGPARKLKKVRVQSSPGRHPRRCRSCLTSMPGPSTMHVSSAYWPLPAVADSSDLQAGQPRCKVSTCLTHAVPFQGGLAPAWPRGLSATCLPCTVTPFR